MGETDSDILRRPSLERVTESVVEDGLTLFTGVCSGGPWKFVDTDFTMVNIDDDDAVV